MTKFEVGNLVKIRKDSDFVGQCNEKGAITQIEETDPSIYVVLFENGYHNSYWDKDLECAKVDNWKERMEKIK